MATIRGMLLQNSGANPKHGIAGPSTLMVILMTLLLLAGERMTSLETSYYDFLQRQKPVTASERILLVNTGAGNSANLWESGRISPVIDALNAAGASVIVPVEAPPAVADLANLQQLTALADLENRAGRSADGDANGDSIASDKFAAQFADLRKQFEQHERDASTVRAAGNVVLPVVARPTRRTFEDVKNGCEQHALSTGDSGQAPGVRDAPGTLTLSKILCEGATNVGFVDYWPDDDGIVRRTHLLAKSNNQVFPALSLAVAQADNHGDNPGDIAIAGTNKLRVSNAEIETGPGFSSLIRYYDSPAGREVFQTVDSDVLLTGTAPNELIRDRIVLVGDLTNNGNISYRTPFGEHMPLAMLLATTVSNVLQSDFVTRPSWFGSAELAILLIIGVTILIISPALTANRAAVSLLVVVGTLMAIEAYLLFAHGVWLQLVTATLFAVLGIGSVQALNSLRAAPAAGEPTADGTGSDKVTKEEDELDLEFSVLRQQGNSDETKNRLYEIAMKHGKRREFAKAERVLTYIQNLDPAFRDVALKLDALSGARRAPAEGSTDDVAENPRQPAMVDAYATTASEHKLGRYQLIKTLGRGAMATVYLGLDPSINRKVAIKTIALAEEFSDADLDAAKNQFRREAESAGRLNHPNIIAIYDTGEDANVAYLAMEYFQGTALNEHASMDTLLPPKWVLELAARTAEALHYAHGQGVVHRDIKPANLMYDAASDQLKITDFGIARLTDTSRTKTGIILGTPSFMSPEQLSASAVTGKSDIYSLGITMYQLLTGTAPFRSDSIPKLMDKIMNEKHPPVSGIRDDIPVEVDMVLDRALAKDPDDRYPNGRAMALALRDACSTLVG
jgi:CHASE2 domain-containing sensor protein/tRNA A-37 threonylcarbamoyl transferase component Bud32